MASPGGTIDHSDGYPRGVGKTLYDLYHGHFQHDIERMMHYLIDEHPGGWSCIIGYNLAKKAGWRDDEYGAGYRRLERKFTRPDGTRDLEGLYAHRAKYFGPMCYCHGDRTEGWDEPFILTDQDRETDTEWAYAINERTHKMHIYKAYYANHDTYWTWVCAVDLEGEEPEWGVIQEAGYARAKEAEAKHAERMSVIPGPFVARGEE